MNFPKKNYKFPLMAGETLGGGDEYTPYCFILVYEDDERELKEIVMGFKNLKNRQNPMLDAGYWPIVLGAKNSRSVERMFLDLERLIVRDEGIPDRIVLVQDLGLDGNQWSGLGNIVNIGNKWEIGSNLWKNLNGVYVYSHRPNYVADLSQIREYFPESDIDFGILQKRHRSGSIAGPIVERVLAGQFPDFYRWDTIDDADELYWREV
jgi:hypothetical protein